MRGSIVAIKGSSSGILLYGVGFVDFNLATRRLVYVCPFDLVLRVVAYPFASQAVISEEHDSFLLEELASFEITSQKAFWAELLDTISFVDISLDGRKRRPAILMFLDEVKLSIARVRKTKPEPSLEEVDSLIQFASYVVAITFLRRGVVALNSELIGFSLSEGSVRENKKVIRGLLTDYERHSPDLSEKEVRVVFLNERPVAADTLPSVFCPHLPAHAIDDCISGMAIGDGEAFEEEDRKLARSEMRFATGLEPYANLRATNSLDHAEYWSVRRNQKWLGFVGLAVWRTKRDKTLWIGFLNVARDSVARSGREPTYGKILMGIALRRAKQRGFKHVYVWTTQSNSRAQDFYLKCGFQITPRLPPDMVQKGLTNPPILGEASVSFRKNISMTSHDWPVAIE